MPPGRGTPREVSERNQRERLFAAMVATVAKKGFEAVAVADLIKLSGVSRSAFYKHFADKEACFLAAMDALVEPVLETVEIETELADAEEARRAFERLIRTIVTQPAASKMYFELYAAGPAGISLAERMLEGFEALGTAPARFGCRGRGDAPTDRGGDDRRGPEGDPQTPQHRTRGGADRAGAELWEWFFGYPPPPGSLRAPRGKRTEAGSFEERQAGAKQQERILRSLAAIVAEKGYRETTVAQIVRRAKTSQRSFYENFVNKEDALAAALDAGSSQLLAAALPALRGAPDWPSAVRDTLAAMFAFSVHEPGVRSAWGGEDVCEGETNSGAARGGDRADGGTAEARAMSWHPRPPRSPPRRSGGRSMRCCMSRQRRTGRSGERSGWWRSPSTWRWCPSWGRRKPTAWRAEEIAARQSRRVARSLGAGGAVRNRGSSWGFEGADIWECREGRDSFTADGGDRGRLSRDNSRLLLLVGPAMDRPPL